MRPIGTPNTMAMAPAVKMRRRLALTCSNREALA
jgi:hypothetical protein